MTPRLTPMPLGLSGVLCIAVLSVGTIPACDDPPAVASPDAGHVSEQVEDLRQRVESQTDQMRESLKPALDDVSVPASPDAGQTD